MLNSTIIKICTEISLSLRRLIPHANAAYELSTALYSYFRSPDDCAIYIIDGRMRFHFHRTATRSGAESDSGSCRNSCDRLFRLPFVPWHIRQAVPPSRLHPVRLAPVAAMSASGYARCRNRRHSPPPGSQTSSG